MRPRVQSVKHLHLIIPTQLFHGESGGDKKSRGGTTNASQFLTGLSIPPPDPRETAEPGTVLERALPRARAAAAALGGVVHQQLVVVDLDGAVRSHALDPAAVGA